MGKWERRLRYTGGVRLFFCVPLPEEAKAALVEQLRGLQREAGGAPLSWTKPEQLHFTLAFLGEQPEEAVPRLVRAAEPCAGLRPFELSLRAAGGFPNARRPHVLWLGVGEGAAELQSLAAQLQAGLRSAGFALEDRPFRAHLTIARVKPGGERGAARALEAAPKGEVARTRVDRLLLMQSKLSPQGAKHTVLHAWMSSKV